MYIAIVALTMFVLPLASILLEHALHPAALIYLLGRWLVFWGVGVRLGLAGARQFFQPAFTATEIFHMTGDEALPLVRELGVANAATALVGLMSLAAPNFTLPVAVSACFFYAVAGVRHVAERRRSLNENVAMVSDLWIAGALGVFIGGEFATGGIGG
jgi:hypothetical protein